mgnify:CR=1 FL=1
MSAKDNISYFGGKKVMRLVKWEPLNEIAYLNNEINKIFNESFKSSVWSPFVDVVETKEDYRVKTDLPGLKKEEIDISLNENILTIKGERKDLSEIVENSLFSKKEINYGQFQKQISLGIDVDADNIKASYIDGVLELVIPKSEKTKLRKIAIE